MSTPPASRRKPEASAEVPAKEKFTGAKRRVLHRIYVRAIRTEKVQCECTNPFLCMALSLCATDSINKLPAGRGTRTPPQARGADLPMISGEKIIGVVGFDFKGSEEIMTTEKRVVLKTIARLGAMAIERMEPK